MAAEAAKKGQIMTTFEDSLKNSDSAEACARIVAAEALRKIRDVDIDKLATADETLQVADKILNAAEEDVRTIAGLSERSARMEYLRKRGLLPTSRYDEECPNKMLYHALSLVRGYDRKWCATDPYDFIVSRLFAMENPG